MKREINDPFPASSIPRTRVYGDSYYSLEVDLIILATHDGHIQLTKKKKR